MTEPPRSTSDPYVTPSGGDAWAADAAQQGKTGTQRLLAVETTEAPDSVRAALELAPGSFVVTRRRLILADGEAVELATSYYPADLAAGTPLAEPAKIRGGAVAILVALGHSPTTVVDTITARWPLNHELELLGVDKHEPLLVLTHTNRDAAGQVVEHAVNVSVAARNAPHVYRMRTAGP